MPKKVKELSALAVGRLSYKSGESGKDRVAYHFVGNPDGLILQCRPPAPGNTVGSRSWLLRTMVGSKRREFGLGGYPDVSIARARERAKELKDQIRHEGIDPLEQKKARRSALIREQAKAVTFETLAGQYVTMKAKEFKTAKQVQKLENQLKYYALPHIGKMIVSDIEHAHIAKMLDEIWMEKNETANRLRLHVEKILDFAEVKRLRSGDNPARWAGNLELIFPSKGKVAKVQHYAALPVDELPKFFGELKANDSLSARALEFIILTASRSGETRGAMWNEIDLKDRTWTIPADRMKAGKDHVVPLSDLAINLIESVPRLGPYVFTGARGAKLTDVAVSKTPKRLGYNVTAHGFRSTFKDWARKYTAFADEVSELALAHVGTDATRAAYARDGLLDKRRILMSEWARYCEGREAQSAAVATIGSGR